MSCNGCRVLRKGCSERCVLRTCLQWIPTPEGQGNATLFLARFFGRSDLLSLIATIPEPQRPALFQSLLFEACGRMVNPVNGAIGLLSTGNWQACHAAVDTVLSGGVLQPIPGILGSASPDDELSISTCRGQAISRQGHTLSSVASQADPNSYTLGLNLAGMCSGKRRGKRSHFMDTWTGKAVLSLASEASDVATVSSCGGDGQEVKLLNLFI